MARGFFGPTPEFDAFIAEYMSPAMRDAGFKQTGFKYTLLGDDKSSVVVGVRLFTPQPVMSFMIHWAAIPRVLRDFYISQNRNWRPAEKWGLVSVDASPPRPLSEVDYRTNLWTYATDEPPLPEHLRGQGYISRRVLGEGLRETLRNALIPMWRAALTTAYLATVYEQDPDFRFHGGSAMRSGKAWLRAILGADDGDPVMGAYAIDFVAVAWPSDPIIPWLRDRLATRAGGQQTLDQLTAAYEQDPCWRTARDRALSAKITYHEVVASLPRTADGRPREPQRSILEAARLEVVDADETFWQGGAPTHAANDQS